MNLNSYIISETKTAFSVPLTKNLITQKIFKQKAFTLAETLITLSIIGVIAAMTIPTLMSNINKHIYVTKLKKVYSQLNHAIQMVPISAGCPSGDYSCAEPTLENLSKHLKIKEDGTSKTFTIERTKNQKYIINGYVITEDGMKIWNNHNKMGEYCDNSGKCEQVNIIGVLNIQLYVDINGDSKGPNKEGRDIFGFNIGTTSPLSSLPAGKIEPIGKGNCKKYNLETIYCTHRVLKEGKMDY